MMYRRGFTLIEAIVYVALLSIIMGGVLAAVYNLTQGATRITANTTVQEEGNFVLRKVAWALTGLSGITTPLSGTSNTLLVTKVGGTRVGMRLSGSNIEMSEDGGVTYLPLTTDNVTASALQFTFVPASGTGPSGVIASFSINGIAFSVQKYLRK